MKTVFLRSLSFILAAAVAASCAQRPLSMAEKADRYVLKIQKALLAQGIDYNPAPIGFPMLKIYHQLNDALPKIENPDDRARIQKSLSHLKCFLGLLVIYAYEGGRDLPGGEEGTPKDRTVVMNLDPYDFFPHDGNVIRYQAILDYYTALQKEIPDYSFAYSALAGFLLLYDDWDEAVRLAQRALALNPDDFLALRTMALVMLVRKEKPAQLDPVISHFKKVVGDGYLVDYLLSRTAKQAGDVPTAVFYAERALSRVRDMNLIKYTAKLYEEMGNLEKARYYQSQLLGMSQYAGKHVYDAADREVTRLAQMMKEKKKR